MRWSANCAMVANVALMLFTVIGTARSSDFQVLVTGTPPGNVIDSSRWQGVHRYNIEGTGGTATPLADIPKDLVFDPAAMGFRSPRELFVANRHGNSLGEGSISQFMLDPAGVSFVYEGNFAYPGMVAPHGLSFNPINGEMFTGTFQSGMFRFRFEDSPVFVQHYYPDQRFLDVHVNSMGDRLFATSGDNRLRQFTVDPDGDILEVTPLYVPGVTYLGSFGMRPNGEMYITDVHSHKVTRFRFAQDGSPIFVGSMDVFEANGVGFSPDGLEMFVSKHDHTDVTKSGLYRFMYELATDSWTQTGFIVTGGAADIEIFQPIIVLGDVNMDGEVNGLDVNPFLAHILLASDNRQADMNLDGEVNGLDVEPFVDAVLGGGVASTTAAVPEASTFILAAIGMLTIVGYSWRRKVPCSPVCD